jgi:hypothetical protein
MSTAFIWPRLLEAIGPLRPAVRVKWLGDAEPTKWEPWIIIPSDSYLETGTMGPVPFREVEWVEVDPARTNVKGRLVVAEGADRRDSLIAALEDARLNWSLVDDKIRLFGMILIAV